MKTINVLNNPYIINDKELIVESNNEILNIIVPKYFNSKIVFKNPSFKKLCLNLEEGSNVLIDLYSLVDLKLDIAIATDKDSSLSLKTITNMELALDVVVDLNGSSSSFFMKNLTVAKDKKAQITTKVNHNNKYTTSNVSNYGISLDNANIVYSTTGKIAKGNSKSVCEQLTRGIIAGASASLKALPILLTDEYDVKANHGASIGKMSDEELFYLMSRGLSKNEAFKLIMSGIINPFLENLILEDEKEKIYDSIYRLI